MSAPRFSERTSWSLEPNAFALELEAARARGVEVLDLTASNPTKVGLGAGPEVVALLGHPRGAAYDPLPFGALAAREAVAGYYDDLGASVAPERVVLSASTSESYGWLFKLLCDPGDRVLVPSPSYPLFSFLADLEHVELASYPLVEARRFAIDFDALEALADDRTRAIVVVHPNNPTGSFLRRRDLDALVEFASARGLAILSDEVFGDYAIGERAPDAAGTLASELRALMFTLSGLSKVVAMPGLKLGWIVASGPLDVVTGALARLEVVADTYLSSSTPVQAALPEILRARAPVQARIRERVAKNLATLDAVLANTLARRLPLEAGWCATIEAPASLDDEGWVSRLLNEHGVLVHPGYFFDMAESSRLVVSLLPEEAAFARAARGIANALHRA